MIYCRYNDQKFRISQDSEREFDDDYIDGTTKMAIGGPYLRAKVES